MPSLMNLASSFLEDQSQLVIVCSIGGSLLGIIAIPVQEVLALPEIRPVHHAPSYVRGVFNLRGRVIVIIDPAVKLELPPQEFFEEQKILVVQTGTELVGILIDNLVGIFPFSEDQLTENPENLPRAFRKVVSGFFFLDGKMVGLLKIEDLLAEKQKVP